MKGQGDVGGAVGIEGEIPAHYYHQNQCPSVGFLLRRHLWRQRTKMASAFRKLFRSGEKVEHPHTRGRLGGDKVPPPDTRGPNSGEGNKMDRPTAGNFGVKLKSTTGRCSILGDRSKPELPAKGHIKDNHQLPHPATRGLVDCNQLPRPNTRGPGSDVTLPHPAARGLANKNFKLPQSGEARPSLPFNKRTENVDQRPHPATRGLGDNTLSGHTDGKTGNKSDGSRGTTGTPDNNKISAHQSIVSRGSLV